MWDNCIEKEDGSVQTAALGAFILGDACQRASRMSDDEIKTQVCAYMCVYVCMCECIHSGGSMSKSVAHVWWRNKLRYVCMYVCANAFILGESCQRASRMSDDEIKTQDCMYVCMYVCMYACVSLCTLFLGWCLPKSVPTACAIRWSNDLSRDLV